MARTKKRVLDDHRTASQQARCTARLVSKRRGISGSARILTAEEVAALPGPKLLRTPASETEEGSETEPEEDTFSTPEPSHVIKLSAEACGAGGRYQWRGRLRGGGADVLLEGAWVRSNFKAYARVTRTLAR